MRERKYSKLAASRHLGLAEGSSVVRTGRLTEVRGAVDVVDAQVAVDFDAEHALDGRRRRVHDRSQAGSVAAHIREITDVSALRLAQPLGRGSILPSVVMRRRPVARQRPLPRPYVLSSNASRAG